jgi:hypothetical protein
VNKNRLIPFGKEVVPMRFDDEDWDEQGDEEDSGEDNEDFDDEE